MPLPVESPWTLVGIGVVAGVFSALFGVGGGIIVVPLLVVVAGYGAREATGTSLAVIGLTALFGVLVFGILGKVEWGDAALVGLPAMGGAFAGTWLQQRVSSRLLTILFALFLAAIAVRLVLE